MWDAWAQIIKKAIDKDAYTTTSLNQIPIIKIAEAEILEAPTTFLSKLEYPYCLNSITILSNLNIHTYNTDTATIIWNDSDINSI